MNKKDLDLLDRIDRVLADFPLVRRPHDAAAPARDATGGAPRRAPRVSRETPRPIERKVMADLDDLYARLQQLLRLHAAFVAELVEIRDEIEALRDQYREERPH